MSGLPRSISALCAIAMAVSMQAANAAPDAQTKRITIHQELLKIYQAKGNQAETQSEFQTLLSLTPSDANLQHEFAQYLTRKGDYGGALAHFRAAVKAQPFNPDFQGDLGAALLRAKDYNGAVEPLRRGGARFASQLQLDLQYLQQLKEVQRYNDMLKQKAKDNAPY